MQTTVSLSFRCSICFNVEKIVFDLLLGLNFKFVFQVQHLMLTGATMSHLQQASQII